MAKWPQFIGGSYESQAVTADCERTVNWFPEVLQSQGATAQATLYPSPGVERLDTELAYKVQPGRAHIFINGREFAVLNQYLVEFDEHGGTIPAGAVRGDLGIPGDEPATISSNGDGGNQLFITSNQYAWSYDLTTNTLSLIAALSGKATMGAYLDGYFLCLDSNTSTLYISALMDGTTWTPGTDFAQRSLAPDKWVSMCVVGRNLWLFGTQTSEVWYDSGGTFPLTPHPSGLINLGCAALWSPKVLGAEVVWLANTKAGHVCVARASGFTPTVISTYPMETAFQTYNSIGTAVGDSYSSDGHTFYLISFDVAGYTWVWDATTTLWSERGTWVPSLGRFTAWRPRFYAHAFGEHRVLDAGGPGLYRMSGTYTRDVDGLMIRRLRRGPAIMNENKRVFFSSFELDLEPGTGQDLTPELPRQPIIWREERMCAVVGNTITKNVLVDHWGAGAYSTQQIMGNGYAEFTCSVLHRRYAFGLFFDPDIPTYTHGTAVFDNSFRFGIEIDVADRIWTIEDNVLTDSGVDVQLYDILKIKTESGSGRVSFYVNAALLKTAAAIATFPMYVMGSLYTSTSEISEAYILSDAFGVMTESPQIRLRLSNDGGRTWGVDEIRGSGKIGEYLTRVRWNRLGAARRRVFEVVVTDSIPWRLTGAYLESTPAVKTHT